VTTKWRFDLFRGSKDADCRVDSEYVIAIAARMTEAENESVLSRGIGPPERRD